MNKLLKLAFCNLIFLLPFAVWAQQWQRVSELPATQMTATFTHGDTLFAAGENRIYFTKDGGQNWDSSAVINPAVDFIEAVHYEQNRLYVGTTLHGVFVSNNMGQTWLSDNTGLTGLGALNISSFASRGDSLYVGTYGAGVFVKQRSGTGTWKSYTLGMPWGNVESLTNIDGRLFAGAGANATMFIQDRPGDTWSEVVFDSFNGEINIFLSVVKQGGVLMAAASQGLYRSDDAGLTWNRYNPGTGILETAKLVEIENRVVASLAKPTGLSFLKFTDDQGLNWQNYEPSLTGSIGYDLAVLGSQLYAARSNGLWRISLETDVEEPGFEKPTLGYAYPNPFTSEISIPLSLPKGTWASLSIFNNVGEVVEELWSDKTEAGKLEVVFSAAGLPSGIYYCKLICGEITLVQKIILAR